LKEEFGKVDVAIYRSWTSVDNPRDWLKSQIERALRAPARPLVVVLDQFEEYFLYSSTKQRTELAIELSQALVLPACEVHLLISIREDRLHLLDGLRFHLPLVLENRVELRHLDAEAIREAIEGPISVFNQRRDENAHVLLGPGFSVELMRQLRVSISDVGPSRSSANGNFLIELPFLQLALQRLWKRMQANGSRSLDVGLLKAQGGVSKIVTDHVTDTFDSLQLGERDIAAHLFHYLVTPSGGKFAYSAEDLASSASETSNRNINIQSVDAVLQKLASSDKRILRQSGNRFELFHDVLAKPTLQWRADYLEHGAFAFLTDALTGAVYSLTGYGRLFGRAGKNLSDSLLSRRSVSRTHILILKTGEILDLRSRYGTTVNAKPLHLSDTGIFLKSGDVICLANSAVLRFHWPTDIETVSLNRVPRRKGAWGILIDGTARHVAILSGRRLALALNDAGELILSSKVAEHTFALLEQVNGEMFIVARQDDPPLFVIDRQDAYLDKVWPLTMGVRFPVSLRGRPRTLPNKLDPETFEELLDVSMADVEAVQRGLFRIGETHFEIVV